MNDIVKAFPFSVLLRNFFAGVFFVAAYVRGAGFPGWSSESPGTAATIGAVIALTSGVTVYALHRAFVNPWIERIRYAGWANSAREWFYGKWFLPPLAAMLKRWDSSSDPKNGGATKARSDAMRVWADYIHLLYSSSFCLGLGALSSKLQNPDGVKFDMLFTVLGIALFVGATVSDWRRHYMEELMEKPENAVAEQDVGGQPATRRESEIEP